MVERLRGIFLTCRLRSKGYWCRFGDRGGRRGTLPEKFPVSKSGPSRSSHANPVLVELLDLGDYANLVPTTRERASLILHSDVVADFEWRQIMCVFRPLVVCLGSTAGHCCFPVVEEAVPVCM